MLVYLLASLRHIRNSRLKRLDVTQATIPQLACDNQFRKYVIKSQKKPQKTNNNKTATIEEVTKKTGWIKEALVSVTFSYSVFNLVFIL